MSPEEEVWPEGWKELLDNYDYDEEAEEDFGYRCDCEDCY